MYRHLRCQKLRRKRHGHHSRRGTLPDRVSIERRAAVQGLDPHARHVHTITIDNGREFAAHARMTKALDARVYFAHPYASWERELNENTNGLIRQYFPKTQHMHEVSHAQTTAAMNALNHRPRKASGFRTPHEVFFNTRTTLTVALES